MRRKVEILLVILILITFFTLYITPAVHAGLVSNAKGESGTRPPPPTPPDAPQTNPSNPGTSGESGPPVVTITHMTSINGYVYEDVGEIIGTGDSSGSAHDSTNNHVPIAGVTVRLISGNSIVSTTVTNENGYYSFSPSPGTYTVEFIYGNAGPQLASNASDINAVRNILKYNGHDYITVQTPEEQDYINVQQIAVQQSGKGAAQVFLAVDCSAVMRSTQVNVNGVTKSRLQIATDSAKELIEKLVESGENIYIGLVFFSGTSYRAVSLTKDTEILYQALDDIVSNGWQTPNTNIVGALDKVMESYYNNDAENSNRYLAILSDGIPTSDGTHETYYDMSDDEIMSTLTTIKQTTKDKVKEVKDDGVKIFSLIVKGDEEENAWSSEIFGEPFSDIFISAQDGQEMVDAISDDLQEYIISTTESKEYVSGSTVIAGYEDAERRKEVDSNFETFNYNNTIMFDQIENYNATDEDINKAIELSEKTWMRVVGGTYTIDPPVPDPSRIEVKNEEGEVVEIIQHVESSYSNQNVVLAQRPAISLVLTTTATALEVTLADHSVLSAITTDVGSELPLTQYMDEEIAHGATIEIEFTIRIKNDSSIQCNYLELVNHLPEGFMFDVNGEFITTLQKNSDYGWETVDLNTLYNEGYISDETLNTYKNRFTVKTTLDNNGQGEDGFYIPPGGEYDLKFVASKVISSLNDLDHRLDDACEVLVYRDSANRRMAYLEKSTIADVKNSQLFGVFPGDSQDRDFSSITNRVYIMPPFGSDENIIIIRLAITCVIVLTVVVTVFILILQKGRKKK